MLLSVPEERFLTLDGFLRFSLERARQDIRSVWRAILACGYDLHLERFVVLSFTSRRYLVAAF